MQPGLRLALLHEGGGGGGDRVGLGVKLQIRFWKCERQQEELNVIGSGVELSLKFPVNNLSWWPLVPEGSSDFP